MKGLLLWILLSATVSAQTIPEEIRQEILAHQDEVDMLIDYVLNGAGKYELYNNLAIFSDDHGPRVAGSQKLEDAIDWAVSELQAQGFDNVHTESFEIPYWIRGEAHGAITSPHLLQMDVLALFTSVSTPPEGITASAIVVRSFDELDQRAAEVPGKIVVYNQPWENYSQSVAYRMEGAWHAAQYGAIASLIRSVTSHSLYTLHTGSQYYEVGIPQIPTACITVEDAEMLQRFEDRGLPIELFVNMTCVNVGNTTTRTVVAELTGTELPNETVIIGGHYDTWDVGYGPMDDGGGVMISWQALLNMKNLGLFPKRTVRAVFWGAEEIGVYGGDEYFKQHKQENESISLIMESDYGLFQPFGMGFTGTPEARVIMEEICLLLDQINATKVVNGGGAADSQPWIDIGVPGATLDMDVTDYFDYHHSEGDSVTMLNKDELDLCSIVWTAVTYVVADLQAKLPR